MRGLYRIATGGIGARMADEKLTKVHVDLPNHWATSGESMWAAELGDDLYELRNAPFYAYNLNFGDVVLATADSPERKPQVRQVIRRSGHRTMRLAIADDQPADTVLALLASLKPLAVSYEKANARYFALDLEPAADVDAIRARLDQWAGEGVLHYETCEERAPGSFDEAPTSGRS